MADDVIAVRGNWYSRSTRRFLGPIVEGEPAPSSGLKTPPVVKSLDEMTKVELIEHARRQNIHLTMAMNRDEMIARINGEFEEEEEQVEEEDEEADDEDQPDD